MQVARWIEEVRAKKVLAKPGRKALRDLAQWNSAGIRRNNGIRLTESLDFLEQRPFDLEILCDRFDNPVAIGDAAEVVLEVAGSDQRDFGIDEKPARALLGSVLDALQRRRIPIRSIRDDDVQQNRRNACIGKVRGDSCAHGTGSEDGHPLDSSHVSSQMEFSNSSPDLRREFNPRLIL